MFKVRPMPATLAAIGVIALGLTTAPFAMADADKVPEGFKPAITAERAVQIAEKATSGKAGEVELEDEDGTIVYEVEVTLSDGTEKEILVDAMSGAFSEEREDDDEKKDS